jgi:hypothetical protein
VEGLHGRDTARACGELGGDTGHPEVRVDDVGAVDTPVLGEATHESAHVDQQFVLGKHRGRTGRDVHHGVALRCVHPLGQGRVIASGVHRDLVALADHRRGEFGDVDVLTARINPAEGGQRTGVLGHHRDLHFISSPVPLYQRLVAAMTSSQSRRHSAPPVTGNR